MEMKSPALRSGTTDLRATATGQWQRLDVTEKPPERLPVCNTKKEEIKMESHLKCMAPISSVHALALERAAQREGTPDRGHEAASASLGN